MRVQEEEEENLRRRDRLIRRTIAFVLFVAIVFVIVDSFTTGYCRAVILSFIEWIQKNPGFGVLAVILVYIFATGKLQGVTSLLYLLEFYIIS